jgi:exoribonuclease-2
MQIKKNTPGSGSSAPQDSSIGALVQYDDEGQVILAVVTGVKKDKLLVLNIRGRELDLIRNRLYFLPGRESTGATTASARTTALQKLSADIDTETHKLDVKELWSFVHEDQRPFSVSELCTMYCGSDTLLQHGALRVALIREKLHFKRDKDSFEPRPPHVVEDLNKAEEAKAKKRAAREQALAFLEQRKRDVTAEFPPELRDVIRLLEEVAAVVVHTDPARQKEAREFVHASAERLGIPESLALEKRAFEILRITGFFHEHTNLAFIRHEIPVAFSEQVQAEAMQLRLPVTLSDYPADERAFRRDCTRLRVVTIDDQSTLDMDDGLSIEQTQDGYELGVHITDVVQGVIVGSAIDRAARRRATSIYCADRTVNMIPDMLSEGMLSLAEGAPRPCISVFFRLAPDLSIQSSSVCASFVQVSQRYSYDQVDELLEQGDATLLLLHDIAAASEERRLRQGAVRVQKREVVPFFETDRVRLQEIHEDSPARLLVSEMMVLANSAMAEFARDNQIPALYRGQERPDDLAESPSKAAAPEGPAKDFSARTRLKKSSVSLEPQYHAGLGLSAYIQATSPIRRYMDICHQRQFLSFLKTGSPWVSREELEEIVAEVEMPLQAALLASRETKRYWLLRYLEQRGRNQTIEGTVVRTDLKTPLVELDEVYITVLARMPQKVSLGQRVSLKISSIDAHADYIRFS